MPDKEIETVIKPRVFWGNIGILLSGIAATILIAVLFIATYILLSTNRNLADQLSLFSHDINESKTIVTDSQERIQQTSDALKTQTQAIAELQNAAHSNKNDFVAAETYYLIKLANDYLQYENDIGTALKLLQTANQNLANLSDPKIYAARDAIAGDLTAVQNMPILDVVGIYVRLNALSEQVAKLPVATQFSTTSAAQNINETTAAEPRWWRRALSSLQAALEHIVVIRKISPNAPPLIAPEQQMFLYQNIRAELEKAQWGLLHHQADIYRMSLQQAIRWITDYMVPDAALTKQFLTSLSELQQINIQPNVPSMANSLQALQTYMQAPQ